MLFPLRSNAGWFHNEGTRAELEKRVRSYVLMYEELAFQDGRYTATYGQHGTFDLRIGADACAFDRNELIYYQPGGTPRMFVGAAEITIGEADASYEADFYPILAAGGLLGQPFVSMIDLDVTERAKGAARQLAAADLRHDELNATLPPNQFQRTGVMRSLYSDAFLASDLALPFSVDPNVANALAWKNRQIAGSVQAAPRSLFLNHWLALGLPNFGDLTWEEVHEKRSSRVGSDFRVMIERVVTTAAAAASEIDDPRELQEIVATNFTRELITELLERRATWGDTLFFIGWNLIPFVGQTAALKDMAEVLRDQQSWITMLAPGK